MGSARCPSRRCLLARSLIGRAWRQLFNARELSCRADAATCNRLTPSCGSAETGGGGRLPRILSASCNRSLSDKRRNAASISCNVLVIDES